MTTATTTIATTNAYAAECAAKGVSAAGKAAWEELVAASAAQKSAYSAMQEARGREEREEAERIWLAADRREVEAREAAASVIGATSDDVWHAYHTSSRNGVLRVTMVTAHMGRCQCGDCLAFAYDDGTIQYHGNEGWQCSERRQPTWPEPRRSYDSQLLKEDWEDAMRALRLTKALRALASA